MNRRPQCCSNPPTLDPSSGSGHVETVGGLTSYVIGSPHSNRAVLLVSDIFGFEAPNLRLLADKVAAAGFYVAVPDFFFGDPFDPGTEAERPLESWLKDHDPEEGFENAKPVIEAIKSKGISAVGAAGFCWGGKTVVKLASTGFIQAAVLLHPAYVTVDDVKHVKAPIAVLGAEFDTISPPQLLKQFQQIWASQPELDFYVKIFPNVEHGWTLRYDVDDEAAVMAAMEAHQHMLEWFVKYVKTLL